MQTLRLPNWKSPYSRALQKALSQAVAQLPIPKVMTYQLAQGTPLPGWDSVQFVRPAHGLVALHGADVVPVTALGLQAGRATHGHRFEAACDPIELKDADSYAAQMREQGAVIASFEERRADIARQIAAATAAAGAGLARALRRRRQRRARVCTPSRTRRCSTR